MEKGTSALKILAGKPTGNRTLGRPRLSWEDNVKVDLFINWVDSTLNRVALVNVALNLRFP